MPFRLSETHVQWMQYQNDTQLLRPFPTLLKSQKDIKRGSIILNSKYLMYQSIPSLTIPRATPGDSHILIAPGVGFSLLCLARGSARGVLNQNKFSVILKKSAIFALSLKRMSSSSFHMFIYARSEQCNLIRGPTYLSII